MISSHIEARSARTQSCEDKAVRMQPKKTFGSGEKVILSVEDDHAAYLLLEIGFGEVGGDLQLYRVEDGQEALNFLRRSGQYASAPTPDLILLNLNMLISDNHKILLAAIIIPYLKAS
jgi:hypothetical protein